MKAMHIPFKCKGVGKFLKVDFSEVILALSEGLEQDTDPFRGPSTWLELEKEPCETIASLN